MNRLNDNASPIPTKPVRRASSDRLTLSPVRDVMPMCPSRSNSNKSSQSPRKPGRKASGNLEETDPRKKKLVRAKAFSNEELGRDATSLSDVKTCHSADDISKTTPLRLRQHHYRLSRSLNDVLLSTEHLGELSVELYTSPPRRPRRTYHSRQGSMNDSLLSSPSCCQLTPSGALVDSPPRRPIRVSGSVLSAD